MLAIDSMVAVDFVDDRRVAHESVSSKFWTRSLKAEPSSARLCERILYAKQTAVRPLRGMVAGSRPYTLIECAMVCEGAHRRLM